MLVRPMWIGTVRPRTHCRSINQSVSQSINQLVNQSINQSINTLLVKHINYEADFYALLGSYATLIISYIPTFWYNLSGPLASIKQSKNTT
jgi:hypothetical protein